MIFAMVVIGGVTRLTESGLSIVEWQPIGGTIPPLSQAEWQTAFEHYQATPQFHFVNPNMTLGDFRQIFWWEYIHRLWGRLIGAVFLVPLIVFWLRGQIDRSLRWPLAGFFLLGGMQGAIGWWMVASGLKDVPWVSPYRLTLHLGFALALYVGLFWVATSLWQRGRQVAAAHAPASILALSKAALALVFTTILAGGFVAGLRAGQIYNEFPLMGDGLVPSDYVSPSLTWTRNFFENPAAAQFDHRLLAITTVLTVLALSALVWRRVNDRVAHLGVSLFAAMVLIQMSLGIATLLSHVPVWLGALHQAGAVTLLTLAVWSVHRLRQGR
jgi:cytochrome c oxidase assembly protein subunit 15